MTIQFGIFDHIEIHGGRPAREVFEERIAMLQCADEGGFYGFHLAEHHGHDFAAAPSQAVFLSALARETDTLKLIPTVVCLPLHHPVRLLEELAMLDVLSNGRLELGFGRGITPFEHLQFGHSPDEAEARTEEILDMLLKGWETGIISSEGSAFYNFLELQLPFKPIQHPYPPLWTAGNVEKAGRGGHNFIFQGSIPVAVRARYDELRTASRTQPGHQNPHVEAPWIAQNQTVVIAATDEQAEAIGRRAFSRYMVKFVKSHGVIPPHLQGDQAPEVSQQLTTGFVQADPIKAGNLIAGSVAKVRKHFVEQARLGTSNYIMLMTPIGDMTQDETMYTLKAFIEDVMPAVREAEPARAGV